MTKKEIIPIISEIIRDLMKLNQKVSPDIARSISDSTAEHVYTRLLQQGIKFK